MKATSKATSDDLCAEYRLSKLKGGVRGKYKARYDTGTNVVLLSPDVARIFATRSRVNAALRN